MACWSGLASDMLEHITGLLALPDLHRFSAVCRHWRRAAKQKRCAPVPQLPWLVLGDDSDTERRKFYNLSEDRLYTINIPELRGRCICGSSHGWLLAVDIRLRGILINPFTRELYQLPPFPHHTVHTFCDDDNAVGDPPIEDCPTEWKQVSLVFKAVLSHDPKQRPDFTLMILVGIRHTPAFWKPGDPSWTVVRVRKPRIEDVVFFNGRFVFVTINNELFAVNFQPRPMLTELGQCIMGPSSALARKYLVDYLGNLLLVERNRTLVDKRLSRTTHFEVTHLTGRPESDVLGTAAQDNALLFLGTNASMAVNHPSRQFPCTGKANSRMSIYFTNTEGTLTVEEYAADMGIFDTKDGTFDTTFRVPGVENTRAGTPIWLTPNPWRRDHEFIIGAPNNIVKWWFSRLPSRRQPSHSSSSHLKRIVS